VIVLDTNVISETLKPTPNEQVMSWLAEHAAEVTITAITVGELSLGLELLPDGRRKTELRRLLGDIFASHRHRVVSFDAPAGQRYGELIARRRAHGRPLAREDAMIAAMCLTRDTALATRNVKDFDGMGLTLINPWLPTGRTVA